jgi:hypothetical protein
MTATVDRSCYGQPAYTVRLSQPQHQDFHGANVVTNGSFLLLSVGEASECFSLLTGESIWYNASNSFRVATYDSINGCYWAFDGSRLTQVFSRSSIDPFLFDFGLKFPVRDVATRMILHCLHYLGASKLPRSFVVDKRLRLLRRMGQTRDANRTASNLLFFLNIRDLFANGRDSAEITTGFLSFLKEINGPISLLYCALMLEYLPNELIPFYFVLFLLFQRCRDRSCSLGE